MIVKYETAKILRSKGYEEIPRYGQEASLYKAGQHTYYSNYGFLSSPEGYIAAPTQDQTAKWLREEYGIWVEVTVWEPNESNVPFVQVMLKELKKDGLYGTSIDGRHTNYEEALEAGILTALALIKNV